MRKNYGEGQRQKIVKQYFDGKRVEVIVDETGVSRSSICSWIKAEKQLQEDKRTEKEAVNFKSYKQLKEHAE